MEPAAEPAAQHDVGRQAEALGGRRGERGDIAGMILGTPSRAPAAAASARAMLTASGSWAACEPPTCDASEMRLRPPRLAA